MKTRLFAALITLAAVSYCSVGLAAEPDVSTRFMPNDRYDSDWVTIAIKKHLERLKCAPGAVAPLWDANARLAMERLATASREKFITGAPVRETLYRLQNWEGVTCDSRCLSGAAPSSNAPPNQACRASVARTDALTALGAMSKLEVTIGTDKVRLPVPDGYCQLDPALPVDASLLSLLHLLRNSWPLRFVAMIAECRGLERWRAGLGPLGTYVQYFVYPFSDTSPDAASPQSHARFECNNLKLWLLPESVNTTKSIDERVSQLAGAFFYYDRQLAGFFDDSGLNCHGVALAFGQTDLGISQSLLVTKSIQLVNQRVISSKRFVSYDGDPSIASQALEVQRALAAEVVRLNTQ
ncbi:MAG: hypothetical protein ABL904_00285 [Hyphomicrobiaceae bacterium]